jgi:hypothetical protein
MGLYVHEGLENDLVALRDVVTRGGVGTISPAGRTRRCTAGASALTLKRNVSGGGRFGFRMAT